MPTIVDSKPSPEFTPISLAGLYNRNGTSFSSDELADETLTGKGLSLTGENVIRGIPFHLGDAEENNILFLKDDAVTLDFDAPITCRHLVFIHTAVAKRDAPDEDGITRPPRGRIILGDKVADYQLIYEDGSEQSVAIRRRFAIGELRKDWGDECFEAVPLTKPIAIPTISERMSAGEPPDAIFGRSQTRVSAESSPVPVGYWVYALENQNPERAIKSIRFVPKDSALLILGLTATNLERNPLRWGRRQKALLTLPEGVSIGRPDASGRYPGLGIDLGQIISVKPKLNYDNAHWKDGYNNKAPACVENQFIVEYCAHPAARFTVASKDELSFAVSDCQKINVNAETSSLTPINPAEQDVIIKIIEARSKKKVAVKLHIHGEAGEYLPPADRHRIPNPYWFEDYSPDYLANGIHLCAYVDGETRVKLPLNNVYIEVSKGFEIKPIREIYNITPETTEIVIEIEHLLPWREKGWVSADTHVHFLSPQTALLEGAGEGVNVVNLLASQWGELFTNVGDFDGCTTFGSKEAGGDGEYLVRVGTENRQHVLGHISLCGYNGRIITPLTTGGPDESALGDAVEVTLSQWAKQCKEQGGVVVLPHFPNPRCENAAAIVLNHIDAVEMTSWGNLYGGIDPYSLSDWYRYLNCGYFVAAVGGTDKMSAATAVGTVRTYALIENEEFTYDAWKEAVRAGRTFATYGPLMEFFVEGHPMGSRIELSANGGTLNAEWRLATVTVPISKVELVVNGETREVVSVAPDKREIQGSFSVQVDKSGWLALRVRGGYADKREIIAAHSSPIMVKVDGSDFFAAADAMTILEQIEGAIAFIDTVATRAEAQAYKAVKMTLTAAHRGLHNRMHNMGIFHEHSPLDEHEHPHHRD
ncbi:MAG: CehA/McbA family metallohydrolase [Candidatus Poribacteria bacterium]